MSSRPYSGFARQGGAPPSPVSLSPYLASPSPPGAPSSSQAGAGPDSPKSGLRTRPGLCPARRVCSSPASLGFLPRDAFDAWRAFDHAGRRLAGPQKSGLHAQPGLHPEGTDCVRPCRPASLTALSPYLATPSPPSAPSSARAGPGPDPTRVGSLPDPGSARRGRAALSLTPLGPLHGDAFAACRDFERASYERAEHWAPGPIRASSFGEGPRSPQRRSALAWRRLRRLAQHCPRRPALGPEPRRVSSRPDPGFPAPAALPILRAGRLRPPPPWGPVSVISTLGLQPRSCFRSPAPRPCRRPCVSCTSTLAGPGPARMTSTLRPRAFASVFDCALASASPHPPGEQRALCPAGLRPRVLLCSLVRPRCALPACHSVLLMPTSLTVVAVDAANPSNLPTPLSSPRAASGRPAFGRPAVG